jgi:hypothetical protein
MIVESKTAASPSTIAGTSRRGLTDRNSPRFPPSRSGSRDSNASPFSASAIFTFCAYGDSGCSYRTIIGRS